METYLYTVECHFVVKAAPKPYTKTTQPALLPKRNTVSSLLSSDSTAVGVSHDLGKGVVATFQRRFDQRYTPVWPAAYAMDAIHVNLQDQLPTIAEAPVRLLSLHTTTCAENATGRCGTGCTVV